MKVIIGFECSGIVRDAFLEIGCDAISCDLKPTQRPGPHYEGDIFDILYEDWDLGIFHPPCTFLTITGNKWMKPEYKDRFPNREKDREDAVNLFMKIARCGIKKMCIENPVGIMSTRWRKPDQIIQPYQFGHVEPKQTCLWLKKLPALAPTKLMVPDYHITKSGKRLPKWYAYADKSKGQEHRAEIRSKTFPNIAKQMAKQWNNYNNIQLELF